MSLSTPERSRAEFRGAGEQQQSLLSYAQETMLFWDRFVPKSAVYNVPIALRIEGALNVAAIKKTIHLILTRHHVLRSHFQFTNDEPIQTVGPVPPEDECLTRIDVSKRTTNGASTIQDIFKAEGRRPFNLANDLMLRAVLFELAKNDHILLLNMHHIASDGWSVGILVHEVSEGYLAFAAGREPELPPLPIQYSGFAKWQRELLKGPELERALSFWREQLAGLPEFTEMLPPDRPRSPQQSFEGATLARMLPQSLVTAMAELGKKRRATVFMVMLAAFYIVLRRYSGKEFMAIGTPVANRARADFLDLIGCFINMVVIRADLSGNPTFIDFLARVRETALAAFFHPELPFSELVRHLHPKRSVSYTPFFQVQLVFQNYPMPTIEWPKLKVTPLDFDTATSKFDLSVLIEPKNIGSKDGMEIGFEYNTQLFEPSTMNRLLDQYTSLLECIVRNPETRIDEFPVSTLKCTA